METVTNYDGSVVANPQRIVRPHSVTELQQILANPDEYPGPVRPMGSYHSLTPCASSTGTMIDMKGLRAVVDVDPEQLTFTAQAGLELHEAAAFLRERGLQFVLNIEIGNMTLGSAACCQTKDALDGVEFGQVNSYVTTVKWVSPSGALDEASEEHAPERLALIRGSYGLLGVVYEVTFRIKPLEIIRLGYAVHATEDLTQQLVEDAIGANGSLVFWTVGRHTVIQTRNRADALEHEWLAGSRRFGWNFLAAFLGRAVRECGPGKPLTDILEDLEASVELGFYRLLSCTGGFTLYDPDKTVDYSSTPESARYAFTFWAFPRGAFVQNLRDYLAFARAHFEQHGFRCNMPLGSYFVRKDTRSLLSYTHDGDVISIDPIHAPSGDEDLAAWQRFLLAFNDWAFRRGGRPLLNQSPFVTKEHVAGAYGERWATLCREARLADPAGRMVSEFFAALM